MKKYLTLVSIAVIMIATPVLAKDEVRTRQSEERADGDMNNKGYGMMNDYFDRIDANRDGYISPEEHNAFAQEKWMEADKNDDGMLSRDEVRVMKKKMHGNMKGKKSGY